MEIIIIAIVVISLVHYYQSVNDEPTDITDLWKNDKPTNIIDLLQDAYYEGLSKKELEEQRIIKEAEATMKLLNSKEYQQQILKEAKEALLKLASELEEKREDTSASNGSLQRTGPIKANDLNSESIMKKEYHLEITLTPDRYLDHSGLTARRKLFNSRALQLLKIRHDSGNAYDTKAIKVFYDNTVIGFIIKMNTNGKVDEFCFKNNSLLKDVKLTWEDGRLILTKLD